MPLAQTNQTAINLYRRLWLGRTLAERWGVVCERPRPDGPGHPADTTLINSPTTPGGRAWGISYFLDQQLACAQRPLAGAPVPGQTFSMALDMRTASVVQYWRGRLAVGHIRAPGPIAYGLALEAPPSELFYVNVLGPNTPFATYTTDIPASDQFIHLDVAVIDDSNVRVTLESLGPDGASASLVVPDNVSITDLSLTNEGVGYLPDADLVTTILSGGARAHT